MTNTPRGRLESKVALISWAARGQGAAQARMFVAEGASVMIADIHDEHGRALAQELGPRALFQHLDVGDEASWTAAVAAVEKAFGKIDILVNGAGINHSGLIEETSVDDFMGVVRANQLGPWLGMRAVIRPMRANGGGAIVNVISSSVRAGFAGKTAYAGSKHAIHGISAVAARELGRYRIRVNAVLPGGVATELNTDTATLATLDAEFAEHPIPRIGRADEIARAVVFLASDDASYCTGAELIVDGGGAAAPLRPPARFAVPAPRP